MKAAVLVLVLAASVAHADTGVAPAPANVLLADVGLHVVGVGYQRELTSHVALQLAAESYTPWTQEDTFFAVQGFVVRARPYFFKDAAPAGWWLSPFVQAGVATATRGTGPAWAVGASLGYAWLAWQHLHLSLGVGAQYDAARIAGGSSRPAFAELWPQIDGSVGYAF